MIGQTCKIRYSDICIENLYNHLSFNVNDEGQAKHVSSLKQALMYITILQLKDESRKYRGLLTNVCTTSFPGFAELHTN